LSNNDKDTKEGTGQIGYNIDPHCGKHDTNTKEEKKDAVV
jgi:hypothetical protein